MAVIDSRSAGVLPVLDEENAGNPINAVRAFIAQITGLDLVSVRQAFLREPSSQPSLGKDWCAVQMDGITVSTPLHKGTRGELDKVESGFATAVSHQVIGFMVSFYGANAMPLADRLREGMQLTQSINYLKRQGLTVYSVADQVERNPDFAFGQWIDRYTLSFRLARKVSRKYGVRTLVRVGELEIQTEKGKY